MACLVNSDKVAKFFETTIRDNRGDNSYTNFLNKYPILRNVWNVLIAEVWMMFLGWLWRWGYHTSSMRNKAFLLRYYFLLFVTLYVVPIFNINSLYDWVKESYEADKWNVHWNCVILADNGAYYINNMIIMALFGTGLMLLRWRSLFKQIYICLTSSSKTGNNLMCFCFVLSVLKTLL